MNEPIDQTPEGRPKRRPGSVDPVSMVGGLLLAAVGAIALVDRFWTGIDPVAMVGAALAAAGVAVIIVVAVRRFAHRER